LFIFIAIRPSDRIVHNHPSADPSPSRADTDVPPQIVEVAKPLGVAVQDRVVSRDGVGSSAGWLRTRQSTDL